MNAEPLLDCLKRINYLSKRALIIAIMLTLLLSACSGGAGSSNGGSPRSTPDTGPIAAGFRASNSVVDQDATATLSWNLSAQSCRASDGWNGERSASGREQVGPISARTTYTLTCSSDSGNIIEMVEIRVNGSVALSWVPPNENADGSELNDLAGYHIYVGERSRAYDRTIQLPDATATDARISLPSGSYHVAMTAFDLEGNESAYSNEVLRSVP
jgi:hypothetical protein